MDAMMDDPCSEALLALERSGERGLVDWLARHPEEARAVALYNLSHAGGRQKNGSEELVHDT